MELTKEEIRNAVREALNVKESDLISKKSNKSWSEHKSEFKEIIDDLLNHIEDDEYKDANDLIGDAIDILKAWKKKIKEGKGKIIDEEN